RHTRFSRDWSSDVCSSDLTSTTSPSSTDAWASSITAIMRSATLVNGSPQLGRNGFRIHGHDCGRVNTCGPNSNFLPSNLLVGSRSEERRVGKEGGSRGAPD